MSKFFLLSAGGNSLWKNLAEWYQNSVICEILTYLEENYFSVALGSYQNFSVAAGTATTLRNIVLGIAIGLIIAGAMIAYTKQVHGKFVRTVIRSGCTSPENAKTLSELGYFQNPSIRRELTKRVTFGKLVRCVEEDVQANSSSDHETSKASEVVNKRKSFSALFRVKKQEFKIDFTTMHFYIPEDLRYRAEIRFERKGSTWGFFAIVAVITVVISSLLCIFLPDLFRLADNLITLLSP
ncbi:MAG: hypothetical protein IJW16_00300 [Clostridia bacterium]|nr:hypothetical protein [Clostridia bacterium]